MLTKVFFASDNVAQDSLTHRIAVVVPGLAAQEEIFKGMGVEKSPRKVIAKRLEQTIIEYGDASEEEADAIRRHEYGTIILSSYSPLLVEHSDIHLSELEPGQAIWVMFKGPLYVPESKSKIKWKFENSPQAFQSPEYPLYSIFPYIKEPSQLFDLMRAALNLAIQRWFTTYDIDALLLRDWDWWINKIDEEGIDSLILKLGEVVGKDIVSVEELYSGQMWTVSTTFAGRTTSRLYNPFEFESLGILLLPLLLANPYLLVDPGYLYEFPVMDLLATEVQDAGLDEEWRYKSFCHEVIRALELKDRSLLSVTGSPFKFDTPEDPRPEGSTRFKLDRVVAAIYARTNVLKKQYGAQTLSFGLASDRRPVNNIFKNILVERTVNPKSARDKLTEVAVLFATSDGSTEVSSINRVEDDRVILEFCEEWAQEKGPNLPILPDLYVGDSSKTAEDLIHPTWSPTPTLPKGASKLSLGQESGLWNFYRHQVSGIAGPPGTGKTYLIRKIQQIRREIAGDAYMVVLSPTNRGAQRVYESISENIGNEIIHIFGRQVEEDDEGDKDKAKETEKVRTDYIFHIGIGTIASFLTKVNTDSGFANLLQTGRKGMLIIDEMSMTSPKEVARLVRFINDCGKENMMRVLLLGDPYQLPSVDPGNAYTDLLRILPTTILGAHKGDQQRFSGQLEVLFQDTRQAMSLCEGRHQLVRGIEEGGPSITKEGKKIIHDGGYSFPDPNLHVYTLKEPIDDSFEMFSTLEWRTIRILYRVIAEWYRDTSPTNELGEPIDKNTGEKIVIPRFPPRTVGEFNFLMKAILNPNKPFIIVPYYYKHLSLVESYRHWKGYDPGGNQIRYISSARRVNEWIISMLAGDFGGYQPWWNYVPRVGRDPKHRIRLPLHSYERFPAVNFEGFNVDPRVREVQRLFAPWDLALRHHQGLIFEEDILTLNQKRRKPRSDQLVVAQRHNGVVPPIVELEKDKYPPGSSSWFLSHYHRPYLVFHPGAPFVVRSGAFRDKQVFKGEIIWFHSKSNKTNAMVFLAEDLTSDEEDRAYRQIEIPVEMCNKSHIDYGFAVNTHQVQGSEKPLVISMWYQPHRGAAQLDLRSFYTAITRSRIDFDESLAKSVGRCVIIAGQRSLETIYDLEVSERATPFIRLLEEVTM